MKKQTKYYLINICNGGSIRTIRKETKKEKNEWLLDYFTVGEERWWAWILFEQSNEKDFGKFVKKLIKHNGKYGLQSFHIRKGKFIIIQEKNK